MSPLWGFGCLVYPVFYKHAAPLGLNAARCQNSRRGIRRRSEVSSPDEVSDPILMDSIFSLPIFLFSQSLRPLGLWVFGV